MRHSGLLSCQTMKCPQKRVNSMELIADLIELRFRAEYCEGQYDPDDHQGN